MLIAITCQPSRRLNECELTFLERVPIDIDAAERQHADYCRILTDCGAYVFTLGANDEYPDSVFVEDTAVVLDEIGVMCLPGAASRRGEVIAVREVLAPFRPLREIVLPATVDGGDVLRMGRQLFVGISSRTNEAGAEAMWHVTEAHGYRIVPVTVSSSLHLKTGCTALDENTVIMNSDWVEAAPFAAKRILNTPPDEPFGANVLQIGDTVLMNAACPRTMDIVSSAGYTVRSVEISEFAKAEAGLTCMSVVFEVIGTT